MRLPIPIGRQRDVVALLPEGHFVVLGTAGSGKTTMAVHRAAHVANPSTDHGGPTLLVTFNRFEEVRARVLADGAATHGHPLALLGAQVYAYAVWITMRRREPLGWGQLLDEVLSEADSWACFDPAVVPEDWAGHLPEDYSELWGRVAEQLLDSLQLARNEMAHGALALDEHVLRALGAFSKESGAGTVTAAAVLYLASRHAAEPHQGLLQAAFARGADTDTLAAMTSALLGVVHGSDWLGPLAGQVMDSEFLRRTAAQLGDFDDTDRSTEPYSAGARRYVESALAGALPGASMALPFYGEVTVTDVRDLDNRTTRIRSWWMRNTDGQTFRIKRFSKAKRSPWIELPRPQAKAPASGQGNGHPRTGLVVGVSDLERSRHFYERVIGMPVTRRTRLAIGLAGWLALEPASSPRAASTDSRAGLGTRAAITVYTDLAGISATERRLVESGADVTVGKTDRGPVLRTVDPDGIHIEIRIA